MAALLLPAAGPAATPSAKVDFQRDVRPLLSQNCFKCHGPDENARKAKLRLDVREQAVRQTADGRTPIVPGKPDKSELVRRILTADADDRMPPAATKIILTDTQKNILRDWIKAGAPYPPHWAFVAPKTKAPPAVKDKRWPQNPIDNFVLARLEREGLRPALPADAYTLARRVSLDLIGLPPTPEETEAFLSASRSNPRAAYEALVDRLLASPHYGERWARRWLDLARYADTNGYEKDAPRSIWLWRDWVINAFNADLPFDQFTVWQIAGDLLPGATSEQRIATGFNRNAMLNEEGGIDPLEYRYHATVDRVAVVGTTWLGLTVGCAQCHAHKFDPIPHREYYQFMAFLDNADEPELEVVKNDITTRRKQQEEKIASLIAGLPDRWPVPEVRWHTLRPQSIETVSGVVPQLLGDDSALFAPKSADKDVYTFTLETEREEITHLRLEALADALLPKQGPGRAESGNFVLTEITLIAGPKANPVESHSVKFAKAEADAEQEKFSVAQAIDDDPKTGWAVATKSGKWNVSHAAIFKLEQPLLVPGGLRLVVRLEQQHGGGHTLGRVRLSVGEPPHDDRPLAVRQRELRDPAYSAWLERERTRAVPWRVLRPAEAKSNLPYLAVEPDDAVFASGDITKSDTYELKFSHLPAGIQALRLEVLPDDRLPAHGPGMTAYEGPKGDFFMGEFQVSADGQPVKIADASESYAGNSSSDGPVSAKLATDGDATSGWSCSGRFGQRHEAVFNLAEPLAQATELRIKMVFGRHYACSLGRFRLAATTASGAVARDLPNPIQDLLLLPDAALTSAQREQLYQQFLLVTPDLAAARKEIDRLRQQLPKYPTTLVMRERPPENPRPTFIHHRGEFLQPGERVTPGVLSVLHPFPKDAPRNRLGFARWLVARDNPLTARVAVNREWAAFFGQGMVRTLGDFGYQGEAPSHPELLDWLALEFMRQGWSLKKLHKLIVMSATYQQDSRLTPQLLEVDPENRLLARGPRVRLEAELIRDSVLCASGLLTTNIGGPSVFPPQPPGVSSEGAYGPLEWKTSTGPDRYRRALYTFSKRTAPFAMFAAFDAPSGEACVARREVSNSPLQALSLMNDLAIMEAARALGRKLAGLSGAPDARAQWLCRAVLGRPAAADEVAALVAFYETQKRRFAAKELDAAGMAGEGAGDPVECAAWTTVVRVLFNLDETITKN